MASLLALPGTDTFRDRARDEACVPGEGCDLMAQRPEGGRSTSEAEGRASLKLGGRRSSLLVEMPLQECAYFVSLCLRAITREMGGAVHARGGDCCPVFKQEIYCIR